MATNTRRTKFLYGTIVKPTDRHEVEWIVKWEGEERTSIMFGGDLEVVTDEHGTVNEAN